MAQNSWGAVYLFTIPSYRFTWFGVAFVLLSNIHWFLFLFCFSVSQTTHSLPTDFFIPLVERETFPYKGISRKGQQFPVAELFLLFSLQLQNKPYDSCQDRGSPLGQSPKAVAVPTLVARDWAGVTLALWQHSVICGEPMSASEQHQLPKQKYSVRASYGTCFPNETKYSRP